MGNRENRFRVLAVILSVLFFCAGIVLTLGIFLPIAGFTASHYALFAMGQRVFSVYGFSSFLIPLLFIWGGVAAYPRLVARIQSGVAWRAVLFCYRDYR